MQPSALAQPSISRPVDLDRPPPVRAALPPRAAIATLAVVAVAWGVNWPVGKALLVYLPPIWATALRSALATLTLTVIGLVSGRLVRPRRADLPVILSVGGLHMTAFAALMGVGLQFVPAGRAVVLAYTTPLWVVPGAWLLLGERPSRLRLAGVMLGLLGLVQIFGLASFDWHDARAVLGNGLILIAAVCWSASILVVRGHRWVTPPFELTVWQALLATSLLVPLALLLEGLPRVHASPALAGLLLYGGVIGSGLAYAAATSVNRALPASLTSLGFLGVPMVGVASSKLFLAEPVGGPLLGAMALICGGITLGAVEPGFLVRGMKAHARRLRDEDQLRSMSARELNDLAIGRGEIGFHIGECAGR